MSINVQTSTTVAPPVTLTLYTDGSTCPGNPGPSGFGFSGIDNAGLVHEGYGPVGILATNNIAELTAVIKALKYAYTHPTVTNVVIYSDSRYVIDGTGYVANWAKKKWQTSSGTLVANIDLWKLLTETLTSLKQRGCVVAFTWVRGHSGIAGNERADHNANLGRLALLKNILVDTYIVGEQADQVESDAPIKKAKTRVKTTARMNTRLPPLLLGKRLYFNTNTDTVVDDGRSVYTLASYDTTQKDKGVEIVKGKAKANNKNLGKRNPDTSYAILVTKTPCLEINSLRDLFNSALTGAVLPVILDLTVIRKAAVWKAMVGHQNTTTALKGNLAVAEDSSVLGEINIHPKLTFKLTEIYNLGYRLLDAYENTRTLASRIDITHHIYDTVKSKQVLNEKFVQGLKALIIPNLQLQAGICDTVLLNTGIDLPNRNEFSNILKETQEPITVSLMVYDVNPQSYRVATVIAYGDNVGLIFAPDSNFRIIRNLTP